MSDVLLKFEYKIDFIPKRPNTFCEFMEGYDPGKMFSYEHYLKCHYEQEIKRFKEFEQHKTCEYEWWVAENNSKYDIKELLKMYPNFKGVSLTTL